MRPHRIAWALYALCWLPGIALGQINLQVQCKPGQACPVKPAPAAPQIQTFELGATPGPWSTVVRISATDGKSTVIGTGVIIDGTAGSALVITAAHVIKDARGNPLKVETFAASVDRKTGSTGPAVAAYRGEALDRDDGTDVGLVRFKPPVELPSSPLIAEAWSPSPGLELVSMGCSKGADPTLRGERLIRADVRQPTGPYLGLACWPEPPHGRSGGGLFDNRGKLIGVCNFGGGGEGIYADPHILRSILVKNGFAELAAGNRPRPSQPQTTPAEPSPYQPPASPSAIAGAEQAAVSYLGPILAGSGIAGTGLLASLLASFRRKADPIAPPASVTPEQTLALLMQLLGQRAEQKAQAEATTQLLGQVESIVLARLAEKAPPKP